MSSGFKPDLCIRVRPLSAASHRRLTASNKEGSIRVLGFGPALSCRLTFSAVLSDASIASRYFASLKPELAVEWRRFAMGHQKEINVDNFRDKLSSWARQNGADPDKLLAALGNAELGAAVDRDYQDAVARGIARTPTALVDGEPFIETFKYEDIAAAIEKAASGR